MIAQTGIESASPTTVAPTESASNAIWWLVPLAIACLGLIWYLRRLNIANTQSSSRKGSEKSPSSRTKVESSYEPDTATASETNRPVKSSKSSSKKKKKAQASNQQNGKKQKGKLGDANVVLKGVTEPNVSSQQLSGSKTALAEPRESVDAVPAQTPVQTPQQLPVPISAIFEPLRNVAPPRRKISSNEAPPTEDLKPKSVSVPEESTSRQPLGGKFERMVPSTAYTRAAASRWPASMANTVERAVSTRAVEVMTEPASAITNLPKTPPAQPTVPAGKGLKSFVSKRKGLSSTDSVSDGNVAEETNETKDQ